MEAAVVGYGPHVSLVDTLSLRALVTAMAGPVEGAIIGDKRDHVLFIIHSDPFFVNIFKRFNFILESWFEVSIIKVFTKDVNVDSIGVNFLLNDGCIVGGEGLGMVSTCSQRSKPRIRWESWRMTSGGWRA